MRGLATLAVVAGAAALGLGAATLRHGLAEDKPPAHTPPPESAIPNDEFGAEIRLGKAIFDDTKANAGEFVGNSLRCANCHLDSGRKPNAGPLGLGYVTYPQFRTKNHKVNTYEERLRDCFWYSMNGKPPPRGDRVLVALEAYSYFLARGAPTGVSLPGKGYLKLPKPEKGFDFARGEKIFAETCARCHGADGGGGQDGKVPPLWGPNAFNWGAGMGRINQAAGFIKANMPFDKPNILSDQDAWDVAFFVDSHERPQDPRYETSVAETRKKNHDTPMSMYGRKVGDAVLGTRSWTNGIRAAGTPSIQGTFK